jgi:predicted ABC-type sugar transport system permease subunit
VPVSAVVSDASDLLPTFEAVVCPVAMMSGLLFLAR